MPTVLIIILALVLLILFHELGHFLLAKKYGVKVEEFGIGIPPRAIGKKIGETIYSLNWIPLGGFVKLYGEDQRVDDERSFSSKPIYQRALILFGGIAAFFVIAFLIFTAQSIIGVKEAISEEDVLTGEYSEVEVITTAVFDNSPAKEAGMRAGDVLLSVGGEEITFPKEATEAISEKKGEEVDIEIFRGGETVTLSLIPREDPPEDEGAIGIGMTLAGKKQYPLYYAPIQGVLMTWQTTAMVLGGFYALFLSLIGSGALPAGMEVGGPVAIVGIGAGAVATGASEFLQFLGAITISLAVINGLPIPALDGGKLMFLLIEKIKGGPIPEKIEVGLNAIFFLALMGLMIFITFKDLGL